ncbi:hypothetical protein vseg_000819 [Gypsophila vaccaria]
MDPDDRDEIPMLTFSRAQLSETRGDSTTNVFRPLARIASVSTRMDPPVFSQHSNLGHTGPLRRERRTPFTQMSGPLYIRSNPENQYESTSEALVNQDKLQSSEKYSGLTKSEWVNETYAEKDEHLLKSGQLGMCNDPYCTTCPSYYTSAPGKFRTSDILDMKFHNALYGDAKGWAKKFFSFVNSYIPAVMNPHNKVVQQWNKFFVISCLVAIFVDPLFFFVLSVLEDSKCIVMDRTKSMMLVASRSITDFVYLIHILLQFRLAYVAPESRVVGSGDLVSHPAKIAKHYFTGFFIVDFFAVLPVPQIILVLVLPNSLAESGANYAKNLLRAVILVQYIPRLYRFLPLLAGQSPIGFVFESAWANFVLNILTFVLSGHLVGSCWYLFGLQRVNQCLRDACHSSGIPSCMQFIDCGYWDADKYNSTPRWRDWTSNENASKCFLTDGANLSFDYGIYLKSVNLVIRHGFMTRYIYSLFWGFQQISTLAGNQVPSYFIWEVLFTMAIIGLGLLLFAILIGNMQNFLQSLGRRRLEMSLRRRDVEQWMTHRRLPEVLKRKVRESERFSWAATRGVNEDMLLRNLPEELQREIRRHLFRFITKVRIFQLMDEPILDAICERLRQKTYIKDSRILNRGGFVDKMVFVVRGKMQSIGEDNIGVPLSEGDVCGEELLTWCLEHSADFRDAKKGKIPALRLQSNRTVRCLTNVEVFVLKAEDLEEVTSLFSRFLRNPRVQGAIRYESPYWRCFAATRIQVAWRYRKKRLCRIRTEGSVRN